NGHNGAGVELALALAFTSEKCRSVERGEVQDWFLNKEMQGLQEQFESFCFQNKGAPKAELWASMSRAVASQLGTIITSLNKSVAEGLSKANILELRAAEVWLPQPT